MTKTEIAELCLIALLLFSVLLFADFLSASIELSTAIFYSAGLLLFQGLCRDLWYLFVKRTVRTDLSEPIVRQCMCVESSVGVLIFIVGLLLLITNIDVKIVFNVYLLIFVMSVVLLSGFLIKDYVIEWNPWKLSKEKDHMNIIFSLKKP